MTTNLSWPQYFMCFAELASRKSKDETQVGAVLIGPEGFFDKKQILDHIDRELEQLE